MCIDKERVLDKWASHFNDLLNVNNSSEAMNISNNDTLYIEDECLDSSISYHEVYKAVVSLKNGTAEGVDNIPVEVLKCDNIIHVLHKLISLCFESGMIPSEWNKGIIAPIPKGVTSNPREPTTYRGITMTSCVYKVYCKILNDRLYEWIDDKGFLYDEQNGFRQKRSTIDHVSSITSIIETRKQMRLSTFASFIDFSKAYDNVNRELLFENLVDIGLSVKFLDAIKAIFSHVQCCVKVNNSFTKWFSVTQGLKQGCILSPILFNMFINTLVRDIKALDVGIDIDGEKVAILLYADDIVLLGESENDLQLILNVLNSWCLKYHITVGKIIMNLHARASDKEAERLLEACNGNLDLAIDMHMDGGVGEEPEPSTSGAQNIPGEDDVRAPIPQKNETLVEDVPAFVVRGRRRQARSVFDGFRDFKAEAKQQEEMLKTGGSNVHKKRTLEDLFRPPIDLTYKGTFAHAREAGTSQHKYIMVNIQNVQEFVCQALNRDVWSNSSVKSVIKDHFIFWQVYHDSEEGAKFTRYYKIEDWPYVAIIDPRTGENMVTWNRLDAITFCDLVTEFLSDHPFSDSMCETPPSKRLKRESSIVDLSEDDQLQAAIKASLDQDKQVKPSAICIDSESDSDELETFSDTEDECQSQPKTEKKCKNVSKLNDAEKSANSNCSENADLNSTSCSENDVNNSLCQNSDDGDQLHNGSIASNNSDSVVKDGYKKYLGCEEDPKSNLLIRFPDGNRSQLSISCKSKLMALVLYVCEQGFSNERYELVTNFPRRKLSYMDFDITLEDAGLYPQESIFVQAR
ncbi:hypothetical protein FSP39_023219 [Pinctada imbricata]|uniref:UBX domain-containing protein 7 n=1 Tax=Pinctada imbricata TaxID=66713 RepID=A0AA89C8K8_PINIB|nr:hypothetical protein FSP39_023219 [Pinctada imbricata]